MFFGSNLQFLRKKNGMTQENLAERMGVSRQTISKWESGEASPELGKLLDLCDIFSCDLEHLIRRDMTIGRKTDVRLVQVKGFRMARYTVISAHPEEDSHARLEGWEKEIGLSAIPGYRSRHIGWAFPWVSQEQKRMGMSGYCAACVLPEGFDGGQFREEIVTQKPTTYAMMTVSVPAGEPLPKASRYYPVILEQLSSLGAEKSAPKGIIPCFERKYEDHGMLRMDVFVHCHGGSPEEEIEL